MEGGLLVTIGLKDPKHMPGHQELNHNSFPDTRLLFTSVKPILKNHFLQIMKYLWVFRFVGKLAREYGLRIN